MDVFPQEDHGYHQKKRLKQRKHGKNQTILNERENGYLLMNSLWK
tara:strand:+ start:787 stop:921 length:135 start_codon:yes stop_codon:yes gene_type:complete